ncbi:hypothetical protein C8U37_11098 [Trichococcus patagoniensis]|uniref:Uncharacterized protein n=1 Tax=Trichococcus patagoniensis TaxID=382641 RepID=A0A2T5IK20_9LACT|nr:hypothetical protein C8U37_11098 [Trichococcus patagoniensis]
MRSPAPAKRVPAGDQVEARCSPVNGPLTGVAVTGNCFPPTSACWPELGARAAAVLRRTSARRRWERRALVCSGEAGPRRRSGGGAGFSGERASHRSCGSRYPFFSDEGMLAGAECEIGGCPSTNRRSSEMRISCARQLRRSGFSSEIRSWRAVLR